MRFDAAHDRVTLSRAGADDVVNHDEIVRQTREEKDPVRMLAVGEIAHDVIDDADDRRRLVERVKHLPAERVLLREQMLAERAADDDLRHETRRIGSA